MLIGLSKTELIEIWIKIEILAFGSFEGAVHKIL